MRLYLVRHGESVDALNGLHQRPNSPLSGEGVRQAEQIAKRLEKIRIDKVFSSTLERAKQTAGIILKDKRIETEYSDLTVELRKPSILFGQSRSSVESRELKAFMKKNFGGNVKHSDEENFDDFRDRVGKFVNQLKIESSDSVLVVTHGYVMKAMLGLMAFGENFNVDTMFKIASLFELSNTGLTVIEWSDGGWKLITWNDMAHLGECDE